MVTLRTDARQFTVTAHDRINDSTYSEEFDYVIVATGPLLDAERALFRRLRDLQRPHPARHDFRDALEFKGKDLLIVGSSYSAEDIGSQCYKYGAKSVTISYRTAADGLRLAGELRGACRCCSRSTDKTAHFIDGTHQGVDAIILCTGYQHHFPFLPTNCG